MPDERDDEMIRMIECEVEELMGVGEVARRREIPDMRKYELRHTLHEKRKRPENSKNICGAESQMCIIDTITYERDLFNDDSCELVFAKIRAR